MTTKWQGRATAEVKGASKDQVWSLLSDFCNVDKWMPNIQDCSCVDGPVSGLQPGLIRLCRSTNLLSLSPPPSPPNEMVTWATEKLTAIDCNEKWFTFIVVDNNVGIKDYTATLKVIDYGCGGCAIEYTYEADPVEGGTAEGFLSFVDSFVHIMAERMQSTSGL